RSPPHDRRRWWHCCRRPLGGPGTLGQELLVVGGHVRADFETEPGAEVALDRQRLGVRAEFGQGPANPVHLGQAAWAVIRGRGHGGALGGPWWGGEDSPPSTQAPQVGNCGDGVVAASRRGQALPVLTIDAGGPSGGAACSTAATPPCR